MKKINTSKSSVIHLRNPSRGEILVKKIIIIKTPLDMLTKHCLDLIGVRNTSGFLVIEICS